MDTQQYPDNWRALSQYVRQVRAAGQCECWGECGLHCTHPGPRRCVERQGLPALFARGTVRLTTAHLCHDPGCDDVLHLRAMCQRCHLRLDIGLHAQHRAERQRRLREMQGQGTFLFLAGGD